MNTLNSQIMICSEIHHKELGGQVFPYFKYVGYIAAKIWHVIVIFSDSFFLVAYYADRPRVYITAFGHNLIRPEMKGTGYMYSYCAVW
jgi:hypothetical protein